MGWNYINCWRGTFIVLLIAFICHAFEMIQAAKFLGFIGMAAFAIMFVIRFEDVLKFLDDRKG